MLLSRSCERLVILAGKNRNGVFDIVRLSMFCGLQLCNVSKIWPSWDFDPFSSTKHFFDNFAFIYVIYNAQEHRSLVLKNLKKHDYRKLWFFDKISSKIWRKNSVEPKLDKDDPFCL